MRELKFRAWHKKIKKLYKVTAIDFINKSATLVSEFGEVLFGVRFEDIVLEQYTGLKDKNGVEIYECDIVEYDRYSCQVVYCEKTASFRMNKITYPENTDYENAYVFTIFNTPYNIKVINQIHEKGELL